MMDAVQFIPHAKPMVFVSHLIEANDEFAIAEYQRLTISTEIYQKKYIENIWILFFNFANWFLLVFLSR